MHPSMAALAVATFLGAAPASWAVVPLPETASWAVGSVPEKASRAVGSVPARAASVPVTDYQAPLDASVTDPFRPPSHRFGAGNRGLEYASGPQSVVRAAAPGQVSFAGRIGISGYVTVVHPDGVRTTYSHLLTIVVGVGDAVVSGQPLGRAGPRFHFGARIGSAYVDPAILLAGGEPGPVRVHLVPLRPR